MNYYAVDPFDGMFGWNKTADPEEASATECHYWPEEGSLIADQTSLNFTVCQDHISETDSPSSELLKYNYYNDSLADLPQFAGFFPRWYVPSTQLASVDLESFSTTQTMAIIDT